MKDLAIVLIGCWHVHGLDFAKKLKDIPGCHIAGTADCPKEWADELGCPMYESIDEALRDPAIDGVIVASSIAEHCDILLKAAKEGKHVYMEKAYAVSVEDAEVMTDAVEKSGIHFCLSDPVMKAPQVFAKDMMDSGKLGRIFSVHIRMTHDSAYLGTAYEGFFTPAENGGGTFNDMGHKSVHILWNLLGVSENVSCTMQHITDKAKALGGEDSAAAVYAYDNGALGIVECGWMTPKYESGLDVYGTDGCLMVRDDLICYRRNDGTWQYVEPEDLPPAKPYPLNYWIENIQNDTPDIYYGAEESLEVEKMIMAAYAAAGIVR